MFGGRRVVWLKDVNFLAETVTGRAESTLKLVEDLQQLLAALNPDETAVLVTAAPVDRRRSFPKWCEKNADFALVGGDGDSAGEALAGASITLEVSNDGGSVFQPPLIRSLGAVGRRTQRVRWMPLGTARERVFRLRCTDPVPLTIQGATVEA
jgi:DNA polymerase-3 subunit delta